MLLGQSLPATSRSGLTHLGDGSWQSRRPDVQTSRRRAHLSDPDTAAGRRRDGGSERLDGFQANSFRLLVPVMTALSPVACGGGLATPDATRRASVSAVASADTSAADASTTAAAERGDVGGDVPGDRKTDAIAAQLGGSDSVTASTLPVVLGRMPAELSGAQAVRTSSCGRPARPRTSRARSVTFRTAPASLSGHHPTATWSWLRSRAPWRT